jgi:hypothetical protein
MLQTFQAKLRRIFYFRAATNFRPPLIFRVPAVWGQTGKKARPQPKLFS